MRLLRSLVVLVSLCLFLGATVASAAEAPSEHASREVGGLAHVFGRLAAFLKTVWENEGWEIDPWGRCSPAPGIPTGKAAGTPSTDEAGQIEPWG